MAVRNILIWPDPILKQVAAPVEAFTPELQILLDDMVQTMYAADGLGLAAPQVGVSQRIFVVDVAGDEGGGQGPVFFINPEIIATEGTVFFEEGCLSLPGEIVEVERHATLTMRALDREGTPFELEATGLFAIALQHELDHLDGRLLVDRLSALKRELVKKRMKRAKLEQEAERAL